MSKTSSAVVPRSTKMMLLLLMMRTTHDLVVTVSKRTRIDVGSTLLSRSVWPILQLAIALFKPCNRLPLDPKLKEGNPAP